MIGTWTKREISLTSATALVVAAGTVAAALALGVLPGDSADAARAKAGNGERSAPKELPEPTTWAPAEFPRNADGLTYGSDAEAEDAKEAPDLIAVVGDRGVSGFVTRDDLYGREVETPEDAARWERQLATDGAPVIPVFDFEGKQVDQFSLHLGEVHLVEPR
jgi:hypothetical protein